MPRTAPSLVLLSTLALGCRAESTTEPVATEPAARPSPPTTDLEELHAFARLYGYVRFFHPSDEAAALDWDGFAIHGVQRVTEARTRDELAQTLEALFLPVAPTLDVVVDGDAPRDAASLFPADTTGLEVVAWQHLGFGFGDLTSAYASGRTHRERREVPQGYERHTVLTSKLDAEPLRGQHLRLRAFARVDPSAPQASVRPSLFVIRPTEPTTRAFGAISMETRWTELSVETDVPADAKEISMGLTVHGQGAAWLDDVVLERRDGEAWQAVAIDNPGFEDDATRPRKWEAEADSFTLAITAEAHGGERALRVARKRQPSMAIPFDATPEPGELLTASLGAGLRCQLPLSLYSRDGRTLPPPGVQAPPAPTVSPDLPRSPEHPAVRTAAVVVAWNVFQHFYPYFDAIDTDWERVLDETLADALDDATPADTERTLKRMVAQLHDGHGNVQGPSVGDEASVPAWLGWVEGQVVVLSVPEDSPLRRGDVLTRIDGQDVHERLGAELSLASGSPQWKRYRVLRWGGLTMGPRAGKARVELRRGEQPLTVEVERGEAEVPPAWPHEPIEELPGGVWLIDLERAEWVEIFKNIDAIARAPGVVFDARGYPNGTHPVLRHLMSEAETDRWMFVPRIVYPDHERIAGWEEHGWDMTPAPPHIEGKVAFITGGGAVSYAESVMGYVEGLGLGEIVGGPTAGANGNVNPFTTPGGYGIYWTGMKVLKHDGSQHHTIGVLPTVPAEPTIAGVRAGRDELLERALAVVTTGE